MHTSMVLVFALALSASVGAADAGVPSIVWDERSAIKVMEGETLNVMLKKAPKGLSATDPAVCEVALDGTILRVRGKRPGSSTVALVYGGAFKGVQVDVSPRPVAAQSDAGVPFFTWDGEHGFHVPQGVEFVMQGPGGLEKVAPGSHRRCTMTSIGNDQLKFTCAEPGAVTVFLWYANGRRRNLELDVDPRDAGR